MSAVPMAKPTDKIIGFGVIKGGKANKGVRYNKDGTVSKVKNHKTAGESSEVYPFISEEEIKSMIDAFDRKIENATDEDKKWIATRNKLMFVIGVNVGLRASDLAPVRWSFFLSEDGTFKDSYVLQPKKTKKYNKFVKIFFNQTVKKAIENYIKDYPIENMNDYLFKSRIGDGCITEKSLGRIVKDTAEEVGIPRNICSHSLRKTWAFEIWHSANDKSKALVMLQQCLGHSDSMTTMRYIGILDEEKKDMFESVEIGLDYL